MFVAIHFSTCSSFDRGEFCRMRSFGKIPRGGKRGGTSSSSTLCFSWVSTAAMVIFVAFCVYGVYTLTSSSPSSLLSSSHSSRKDGQPFLEEPPADDGSINEKNLHGSGRYEPGSGVSDQDYSRNQKRLENRGAVEEEEEKEENNSSKEQNQMEEAREKDSPINSQVEEQSGGSGDDRPWENQAIHPRNEYEWDLCNATAGPDYIPCLDNTNAVKKLKSFKHFEHRERHCPDESPTCIVPLPYGYKRSIEWPTSRDKVWYSNVPRTKLAEVKGHQNWVKVEGDYHTFPGGGTQFIHGALHYIDFIKQSRRDIGWGKHTRVILDVGCGVASFGGYLFERDVLAMSFAPKDEHEAQIQFALERGIPAISAVMGSQRLPFPSNAFDLIHCARCRVPWHADAGMLLLELNRLLRPGGYFVWSATPVYQKLKEDVGIWKAMTSLTKSMCWDLATVKKDRLNGVAAAFYRKPASNECYDSRSNNETPPMCEDGDDPNRAWYTPLKSCMHRVPERGAKWPAEWPRRLSAPPNWLNPSSALDFRVDSERWKNTMMNCYLSGELGFNWTGVRNAMDMRSVYGGFAAALRDDLKIWVVNVVNVDSGDDTLPIIYERGLFGIYHDWCESFSTYPRTYDLLHADRLFSKLKVRCSIVPVMAEIDRIVRPGGKLIVRDESAVAGEVEALLKSLHWEVRMVLGRDGEGIIAAQKSDWRPNNHFAAS